MFKHFFLKSVGFLLFFLFTTASFAEAYKWIDEDGVVHYTQQAPLTTPAEKIEPPPPPALDPETAQKELEILIEKQNGTFEENERERQRLAAEAEKKKKKEEYCRVNKHNLQLYMDNPSRRVMTPDGTVTRVTEEMRQQKIAEIKQNIAKHCQ